MQYNMRYITLNILAAISVDICAMEKLTNNTKKLSRHPTLKKNENLNRSPIFYLPWRYTYQQEVAKNQKPVAQVPEKKSCLFCNFYNADQKNDKTNLILHRFAHTYLALVLFPYVPKGHVMIIPNEHAESLEKLSPETYYEMHAISQDIVKRFFIHQFPLVSTGFNVGQYSGASLDHIHYHIVPSKKQMRNLVDVVHSTQKLVPPPQQYDSLKAILTNPLLGNGPSDNTVHVDHKHTCLLCTLPIECKNELVLAQNKYTYTALYPWPQSFEGHIAVIPYQHVPNIAALDQACFTEMVQETKRMSIVLKNVLKKSGLNIGSNNMLASGHTCMQLIPCEKIDSGFVKTTVGGKVLFEPIPALVEKLRNEISKIPLNPPQVNL
jgi:diadenosine tetraphosphate (Ap4A) HIT family hydrolase